MTTKHCTIGGTVYEIPEIWLAGFASRMIRAGKSVQEGYMLAMETWAEQAQMEKEWEAEREVA